MAKEYKDEQNDTNALYASPYRVLNGDIDIDSGVEVVDPDQRVRMTQAEYDEFKILTGVKNDAYYGMKQILEEPINYPNLRRRLFTNELIDSNNIAQAEFANLWKNYRSEEPDVTIKIEEVVEKWFVRTSYREGNYHYWMKKMQYSDAYPKFEYDTKPSEDAMEFESEEEAEEWLNPQLEVVKLEVVDE